MLLGVGVAALLVVGGISAQANTCMPAFPCDAFERAETVALVRVVQTIASDNNQAVYSVEVKALFKGDMDQRAIVKTLGGITTSLREGEHYVLHLDAVHGQKQYLLYMCTRVWSWRAGMKGELVYLTIARMRAKARDPLSWLTGWMGEHMVVRWMCIGLPLSEAFFYRS